PNPLTSPSPMTAVSGTRFVPRECRPKWVHRKGRLNPCPCALGSTQLQDGKSPGLRYTAQTLRADPAPCPTRRRQRRMITSSAQVRGWPAECTCPQERGPVRVPSEDQLPAISFRWACR